MTKDQLYSRGKTMGRRTPLTTELGRITYCQQLLFGTWGWGGGAGRFRSPTGPTGATQLVKVFTPFSSPYRLTTSTHLPNIVCFVEQRTTEANVLWALAEHIPTPLFNPHKMPLLKNEL